MSVATTLARGLDTLLDRSVVLGYTSLGHRLRTTLPGWPADPGPDSLRGREVIVTGASSGLGIETAATLASYGAHVHCVVRDPRKLDAIRDRLGDADRITAWRCDLASRSSVESFCGDFLASGRRLHAVVHNAGVMPATHSLDGAGRELSMVVHVLAPVLMTDLLAPALDPGARVVFVTSGGMYAQALRLDDLPYDELPYRPSVAYARSKRAQVELLGPLGGRWPSVQVYATHPGWASSPGLDEGLPTFTRLLRPLLRQGRAGVDTTTWLVATEPAAPGGGLWHDRRERPTSYVAATRPSAAEREQLYAWVDEQVAREN